MAAPNPPNAQSRHTYKPPDPPKCLYYTLQRTYKIPTVLALRLSGAIKPLLHPLDTIISKQGEITDYTADFLTKTSALLKNLRPEFYPHREKLPAILRAELDSIERLIAILRKIDHNRLGTISILEFAEECKGRIEMLEAGGIEYFEVRIQDREDLEKDEIIQKMGEKIFKLEGELRRLQEGPARNVGSFWHTPVRLRW